MPNQRIIDRIVAAAGTGSAILPLHGRFGVRALSARPGAVEFGQRMGPWLLDRQGRLSPGAFLVGADAALGSAVASALDESISVMSLSIRTQFVRLHPGEATEFVLRGEATHIGGDIGCAAGEIVDDAGRLVANISTVCCFGPGGAPMPLTPGFPADRSVDWPAPDGGREGPLSPLATYLAGARVVEAVDGELRVAATSSPDLCNSRGDLQGGVLGMLAEQALSACLVRGTPAVAQADNMELHVTFLRAVRLDRPDLELVARSEHASRRFAVARAHGVDSSGRTVVTASGSRFRG